MYSFFYRKQNYVNEFTLTLGLISVISVILGVVLLVAPAVKSGLAIWENQPKKFKLITIVPENCKECFDIKQVSDFVEGALGVKYSSKKEYTSNSKNAELLIKTYNIKVLPTFILQGDVKSIKLDELFDSASIGKLEDKTFVYANKFPPYYDVESKAVKGKFSITYLIDDTCADCYDVYLHNTALSNLVMTPTASSTIDVSSDEGGKLLSDYKIQYVPTILLSGDLDTYQNFKKLWETVGTIEGDGTYIFREGGLKLMGAYENLKTKKVENNE